MRDDFLSDDWARHNGSLMATIRASIAALEAGFARLLAHQFDAPWRHDATRRPIRHPRRAVP